MLDGQFDNFTQHLFIKDETCLFFIFINAFELMLFCNTSKNASLSRWDDLRFNMLKDSVSDIIKYLNDNKITLAPAGTSFTVSQTP